jgi:hypothetical protein
MADKALLRISLDKETHKAFKKKAVDVEMTMQKIIENLVIQWLEQQNNIPQKGL